jgi:uncharacterized protein (DUF1697 family)
MAKYAAFLRGIMPSNPKMRNDKLCAAVETIGATDVRALLSSGNLVFSSATKSSAALEKKVEQALKTELGAEIDAFVRSEAELAAMVKEDPFEGKEHGKEHYLVVTFRKDGAPVFNAFDRKTLDGPEMMAELLKKYGKHQTTRTWATIARVLAKMQD